MNSHTVFGGKSGKAESQYHAPKDETLLRKKSSSKDFIELYTISNHNKKVLGGASCRPERGNVGSRGWNQRLC